MSTNNEKQNNVVNDDVLNEQLSKELQAIIDKIKLEFLEWLQSLKQRFSNPPQINASDKSSIELDNVVKNNEKNTGNGSETIIQVNAGLNNTPEENKESSDAFKERFEAYAKAHDWETGSYSAERRDDGKIAVKFPSPEEAMNYFQHEAKNTQKFRVFDTQGHLLLESKGDGVLRGADGKIFIGNELPKHESKKDNQSPQEEKKETIDNEQEDKKDLIDFGEQTPKNRNYTEDEPLIDLPKPGELEGNTGENQSIEINKDLSEIKWDSVEKNSAPSPEPNNNNNNNDSLCALDFGMGSTGSGGLSWS